MTYFVHKNNELFCENVSVKKLADQFGTPLYIYSHQFLVDRVNEFKNAFSDVDYQICFAMKSNSNQAILKTFINNGCGLDIVTGGELYRALKSGCNPQKIVFSGVGKSDEEIEQALKADILQFNVESIEELDAINCVAQKLNVKAPIAIRVNPDVDPKTHAYISTGLKKAKFGISHEKTIDTYKKAALMSHIKIVGIDCHIGSQLTTVQPFVEALKKIKELVLKLKEAGIQLKQIDLGGGLGICYNKETPPTVGEYALALKKEVKDLGLKLIFEPGRFMVGNSGILVTKVLFNKQRDTKNFVIIDAASNDLMRPSLYDAYHHIEAVVKDDNRDFYTADVVGPICETGDFLAQDRKIQKISRGELMAFMSAGAYGFSMASTYNSRPLCAEVMVKGSEYALVRERGSYEKLIKGEKIPKFV